MIKSIFKFVAACKVFIAGAGLYVSIINFVMLFLTFKMTYKIPISAFILAPLGILGLLTIGFIDYKFIKREEYNIINQKNSLLEIKTKLNKLEELLSINEKD